MIQHRLSPFFFGGRYSGEKKGPKLAGTVIYWLWKMARADTIANSDSTRGTNDLGLSSFCDRNSARPLACIWSVLHSFIHHGRCFPPYRMSRYVLLSNDHVEQLSTQASGSIR